MTPIERVKMMIDMPVYRKPPIEDRVSTLESLVAELAVQVARMRKVVDAKIQ